jgi:pyrroline-5-carboxylate reductase
MVDIGRVGIVGGGGWLGTAIARALTGSRTLAADRLTCSYRSSRPSESGGFEWTRDNGALVDRADVIIISVRPDDWRFVDIDATDKLLISVMAGVTIADLRQRTGSSRIARALPNAAAEIGYSYTPFFLASELADDREIVSAIFRSCGEVDQVFDEDQINYFTAMSGSGAAFPALLVQAMMMDAIQRGVPPEIARRAAQQTLVGAGRLQELSGTSPSETVKSFVDYNGTTAAGILRMLEGGFGEIVSAGLDAAYRKARNLAKN